LTRKRSKAEFSNPHIAEPTLGKKKIDPNTTQKSSQEYHVVLLKEGNGEAVSLGIGSSDAESDGSLPTAVSGSVT